MAGPKDPMQAVPILVLLEHSHDKPTPRPSYIVLSVRTKAEALPSARPEFQVHAQSVRPGAAGLRCHGQFSSQISQIQEPATCPQSILKLRLWGLGLGPNG